MLIERRASSADAEQSFWRGEGVRNGDIGSQSRADSRFMANIAEDCCLTRTSLLMGLYYFKKLPGEGWGGADWRAVWVNCIIVAEKMWEDNYIHPSFVRQRLIKYSASKTSVKSTQLQLSILQALDWKTTLPHDAFIAVSEAVRLFRPSAGLKSVLQDLGDLQLLARPLPALPRMQLAKTPTSKRLADGGDSEASTTSSAKFKTT